jgi:D-alanine-D-alanine ligase
VVVKPCGSGSSVDTWIVKDRNALREALDAVVGRYGAALVEHYIRGPELTVSILGEAALPVCQIRTKREFYNYQAKYIDDDTEYLFDIDLPAELLTRIQEMSLRAFKAVGCRDFARVDWMVDERTLQPCAIEINTIPGLTSHSLLPKAAARVGIGFDALCESVARMAMARKG